MMDYMLVIAIIFSTSSISTLANIMTGRTTLLTTEARFTIACMQRNQHSHIRLALSAFSSLDNNHTCNLTREPLTAAFPCPCSPAATLSRVTGFLRENALRTARSNLSSVSWYNHNLNSTAIF